MMIKVLDGQYTIDGAGVKLYRLFSHDTVRLTDPFLLLDHFGSDDPKDYIKGFPMHPHRGIETVTYMLKGDVEHQDNIGHKGVIGPGDIQWMSAGSGIIHQEMPKGLNGMNGMQLWVNMPTKMKMINPEYRGIERDQVPTVKKDGIEVKVIAGEYDNIKGPVLDLVIDVTYLDITLEKDKSFIYHPKNDYTTLCYLLQGNGSFAAKDVHEKQLILFRDIDQLSARSYDKLRFILVSGKPLREGIAWGGPIVMNTQEELQQAFQELRDGTFIKSKKN